MKKGIYYIPLFLILLFIMVWTFYVSNYLGFVMSTISMLLLGEVYYLRFIKYENINRKNCQRISFGGKKIS